jgi:hypothetical protein
MTDFILIKIRHKNSHAWFDTFKWEQQGGISLHGEVSRFAESKPGRERERKRQEATRIFICSKNKQ